MPSTVLTNLNRLCHSIISVAEEGASNPYSAIIIKSLAGQRLLIDGIQFSYSIFDNTDRGNFRYGYCAAYLDTQLNDADPAYFARLEPYPDYGDIPYFKLLSGSTLLSSYDDFSQPLIVQETRSILVVAVCPYFAAPINSSFNIDLLVRGRVEYTDDKSTHFPYILR